MFKVSVIMIPDPPIILAGVLIAFPTSAWFPIVGLAGVTKVPEPHTCDKVASDYR